jgi:hypothetical protein
MAEVTLGDGEDTESATSSRKLALLALAEVGAFLGATVARVLTNGLADVHIKAVVIVQEELDLVGHGETHEG